MRIFIDYSLSALLICLILATGCSPTNETSEHATESKTRVAVTPVKKGRISVSLDLTGTLAAFREIKINSKIPGRVDKVHVDEGDSVKPGDILMQLEQEELVLGVKQTEAALASAQAHLANMKNDHQRMKNLHEEKAIPGQQWEKVQLGLKVAEAQTQQAQAALALASKQLANAAVRSPIEGIVTKRSVEPGEVVSPPLMPGMPLIQIMKSDKLKTRVNISETRLHQIHMGQKVKVRVDALPDRLFPGKITKIAPVIDPRSRTFEAEINIANPDLQLKPGMFARVTILLKERFDVLLVPVKAVLDKGKDKVVFVAKDNFAQERTIHLGLNDGINTEVLSGVKEGENIVVKGNVGIIQGTPIILTSALSNQGHNRGDESK